MKILVIGSFGFGTVESSYERALTKLGHETLCFDSDRNNKLLSFWLRNRIAHRATIGSKRIRLICSQEYNQNLLDTTFLSKVDLVIAFNGFYISERTVEKICSRGIRFALVHTDNPLKGNYNYRPEVLPMARRCTSVFVWSHRLAIRLCKMGLPARMLPFAWDSAYIPYQGDLVTDSNEVIFVGGWDPQREAFLEFVNKYFNLVIWGPDYWYSRTKIGSTLRKCWQGRRLVGGELASRMARSYVSLNILRTQHYLDGIPTGTLMRTFEAPGAGAFQISTQSDDALSIFEEDQEGIYFKSIDTCLEKLDMFASRPKLRREIIKSSHSLVAAHHQYTDRAVEIIEACMSGSC